jgi:hypothetical protein
MIGKDMKGSGLAKLTLAYYPGICLEVLRKTTKMLSQDSRFVRRDLIPLPPNTMQEC